MKWYQWKRWRLAKSPNRGRVRDADGLWQHIGGGYFLLLWSAS
jgi:hypothetical protein